MQQAKPGRMHFHTVKTWVTPDMTTGDFRTGTRRQHCSIMTKQLPIIQISQICRTIGSGLPLLHQKILQMTLGTSIFSICMWATPVNHTITMSVVSGRVLEAAFPTSPLLFPSIVARGRRDVSWNVSFCRRFSWKIWLYINNIAKCFFWRRFLWSAF